MTVSTEATGPGTLAPTPGTDFVVFACGGGANVEDMASYNADPQLQTGNLPGLARSNFNNRALRQGCFVAAGVSTFVWEVLSIYVPDDGDLDNWVANFKAALQAYITPGGTLPGGPYLPLAGGIMSGNINFQTGATIVLANNTYLRALDSGGTAHGLMRLGTDGNQYIGDGSAPYIVFGATPVVTSGIYWSARDTGGTTHQILGIPADNQTHLQAFNSLIINASTIITNTSIVIPNNNWFYGSNAAGAPITLLGTDAGNITRIAQGAPGDTYIYSAATHQIYLQGATTVTGTLTPTGNVAIGGTLNVAGLVLFSSSLQVNGATNLYARLNVNNSVGATITGDIQTNSIHVVGGSPGLVVDSNANIGGTTNLTYLMVYQAGQNDPMTVQADNNHYARTRYTVVGTRTWSAGTSYDGRYFLTDESAGAVRFVIDTAGNITNINALYANTIQSYGNLSANNAVYVGTAGYYWYYTGGGQIGTNGGIYSAGQMNVASDIFCNSVHTAAHVYVNGVVQFSGAVNMNWDGSYVTCGGPFHITGHCQVDNGIYVNGGSTINADFTVNGNFNAAGGQATVNHLSANNGACFGGNNLGFDYTWGMPIGNHSQWASGLGIYAQFFASYSDERYKLNSQEIEHDALAAILPVKFYSYDSPRLTPDGEVVDARSHVAAGFMAQQLQRSMPDAIVETDLPIKFTESHPESGEILCAWETQPVLGVDLMTLCAYQMRAIQQLAAYNQQLAARIENLEGRAA
jgi:hypothetical protein